MNFEKENLISPVNAVRDSGVLRSWTLLSLLQLAALSRFDLY
jgi:hypothetical protein